MDLDTVCNYYGDVLANTHGPLEKETREIVIQGLHILDRLTTA